MSKSAPASRKAARADGKRARLGVSWPALLIGFVVGIGIGLLYAWIVSPVEEFDTAPWQLKQEDKAHYIVAIMLDYAYASNLDQAVRRLLELRLEGDPIQAVAETACQLASTGYVESTSGLRALRAMMTFYQLQGKQGCADTLLPAPEIQPTPASVAAQPTATFMPPATKTPTPVGPAPATATPLQALQPTAFALSDFVVANISTFCDEAQSGVIEVLVQNDTGAGIPGQQVRVRWTNGEDRFFTGLKPERDPGYADFTMQPGTGYAVDLPNLSDATENPLSATPCTSNSGASALTSYRVIFRAG